MRNILKTIMMKFKIILILIFPVLSFSQNLSLSDLEYLQGKKLAKAEEILNYKGWDYMGVDGTIITFSYGYSKDTNLGEAFIGLYYSKFEDAVDWIEMQFHLKQKYLQYLKLVKSKCTLIESKIDDGKIVKSYKGSNLTYEFVIFSNKDSQDNTNSSYHLIIMPNENY